MNPGLTPSYTHPVQRDAFLQAYKFLLLQGICREHIVFMGDSAGGEFVSHLSFQVRGLTTGYRRHLHQCRVGGIATFPASAIRDNRDISVD